MDKPFGRPTKYKPEFCDIAFDFICEGASIPELAYELKVAQVTINDWMNKHSDFSMAIKCAREIAEGWWMKHGRENIANKDFNSTLWYMNMKNRYGWADKQEVKQDTTHSLAEPTARKVRKVLDGE